eukprot:CAMPEP_0116147668 /NCGR_PEP_ID=MMETSP0329-20121206/17886_1 /TAXON_ID=697910 /ORGANISM="Pseudo-nitzschia arenysensis, Strain B593" /LENGTH=307 /DNA_ID=CAMNT_0003643629 /DNA_START=66 /DNA_END=989 /DNA_ORIENTATION=+
MAIFGRNTRIVPAAAIFLASVLGVSSFVLQTQPGRTNTAICMSSATSKTKGKVLVLGGTGFLGQTICRRALLEGYQVTSLSRRGLPPDEASGKGASIDFRAGDARKPDTVSNILQEGGYVGVVHCIGLLLDDASGLGDYNRFVSGSGSVPDENSSYETITKLTAFNAIDATLNFANDGEASKFPFVFTSAAEAGWPDVTGGAQIEEFLAPEWLKRYLAAKRSVEKKLLGTSEKLRPIIVRPSLIYSLDRPASYAPVGAFFVGNKLGLPFVDRPVTVQSLANAVVKSIAQDSKVEGILRYTEIDSLNE